MSTSSGPQESVGRRQWMLVSGLSVLGAIGVAWGVARADPVLTGLWVIYLVLAVVFAVRLYR